MRNSFLSTLIIVSLGIGIMGCVSNKSDSKLQHARESAPIDNHQVLGAVLKIPNNKLSSIIVGDKAKANVTDFLSGNSGGSAYECKAAGCSCFGDEDCNRMFTQVCSDPATNGSCTGEPPVCTCQP